MTKLRGASCAAILAVAILAMCAAPALAATKPVALDNTPSTAFPPAQNCSCHSNFIQEWQQSMHGKAAKDPVFKAKLVEANDATSGKLGSFCLTCHAPVGTMTNQLANTDPNSAAAQGIPCSFCHQVKDTSSPTNNVSLLLDPSGTYRAQIATPTAPHPTAVSGLHASSEICGACHNVAHPGNGLPVEATYTEWQGSAQAKSGVQCQDCHMSYSPGQIGPSIGWAAGGGPRRQLYQMNFMGAQVALGNPVLAEGMLKSAAKLEMDAPAILSDSKSSSITVTITNTGAGHNLPTGLTEIREMWLQVTFVGPDGKETEIGKHAYGTVLKDANGKFPAELWAATGVQSDDRIPPQGTSVNSYKFAFPSGVDNGAIKAQLLYRSESDDLAKKANVENPTTVMAESEQNVYATIDAERKANGKFLDEASESPLTPLVISILGLVLCFGLVIFFVIWGRRPLPTGPAGGKKRDADTKPEDADDDPGKTAVLPVVAAEETAADETVVEGDATEAAAEETVVEGDDAE